MITDNEKKIGSRRSARAKESKMTQNQSSCIVPRERVMVAKKFVTDIPKERGRRTKME